MIPKQIVMTDSSERSVRMLSEWIRDVQEILTGNLQISDQMGGVQTITYNTNIAPLAISTGLISPPLCVRIVRAREFGTANMQSGNAVSWTWNDSGELSITAIDGLAAATDYEVTIQSLRGVS